MAPSPTQTKESANLADTPGGCGAVTAPGDHDSLAGSTGR